MSQRSKRLLDAQAKNIAAQDNKFVAKLSGQNWKLLNASGELRSSSPTSFSRAGTAKHGLQQPAQHAAASAAVAAKEQTVQQGPQLNDATSVDSKTASAMAGAPMLCKRRTASPLRCVTPDFQPPNTRHAWHKALEVAVSDKDTAYGAPDLPSAALHDTRDPAASSPADLAEELPDPAGAPGQQTVSVILQEQEQQLVASTWLSQQQSSTAGQPEDRGSSPGHPGSPSWWLKAQAAGFRVQPGPVQIESSLYASWAHSFSAADPAIAGGRAVLAPAAAAAVMRCDTAHALPAPGGSMPAPMLEKNGARSSSRSACAVPAAGPRSASPCSSNFCSSRAAGAAAGIAKPGMNLKYQSWLRGQYPGSKPPRREDAESVRVWLQQQLDQLQQQLECSRKQQSTQQQQQQQEEEEEAEEGQPPASRMVGTSNQQHMQQAAEQIFQSLQPQYLLQEQEKLLQQRAYTTLQQGAAADADAADTANLEDETSLCWHDTGLQAQTSQLLLMARQPNGALDVERLRQQEAIYTAGFNELCRQVSVQCVERGHLMAKLWLAVRAIVLAAIEDRRTARIHEGTAHKATAAARLEAERLKQVSEDERVALKVICERHAAKTEAAKQELDKCQNKCDQLQDLLKRLSAAQQLVQRVMDLESSTQQQQTTITTLQQQLLSSEQQVDGLSTQLASCQLRANKAEQQVVELQEQLGISTPRPRRDLGLLTDLLTHDEAQLVEQALITGVPAEHVHRLLLGLSTDGEEVRPWVELAGCCVLVLQSAADPCRLQQQLQQYLLTCDAAGLARYLNPAESIQLVSQAVHVGATPQLIMQLLDGSLGLPCTAGQLAAAAAKFAAPKGASTAAASGANVSSAISPGLPHRLQNPLQPKVDKSAQAASTTGVSRTSVSLTTSSTATNVLSEQQLAALAAVGIGMPYIALVGVLATKYGHDANELGGPVTEALMHAQLSTQFRVQDLESRTRAMHREVVLLKRTLAEQRKHEQERIQEALKDQKRIIARREARQPSLLDKFLQTRWGDYFMGIGLMEELPRVLRANVPINNKRMPKREAEKLAREIWQAKDEQEAAGAPRQHLADVTAIFLERRFFAIPRLVQEVAYNFIYSLGQHSYDADCNLFLRIFTGDVEEAVRNEQQALEGEIMKLLRLLDVSINHQATGWLHKADVKTALAGFFKGKSVDRLSEIYEALDTDEPGDALHYPGLFSDDDDLNQGMSAEIIRSQHLQERLEFLQEVEDSIRDAAEDNQTTSLTPAMLRNCIEKTSRIKDPAALDAFVSRAFGPDWQRQQHRLAQPLGQVIRAIRRGSLRSALHATATTAATAVSKIAPVGKFKTKLMSALKVGLNESSPAGGRRLSITNAPAAGASGSASAAAVGSAGVAAKLSRRSTTLELPMLSCAASGQIDRTSEQRPPGGVAAKSCSATSAAVIVAAAAVLAGGGAAAATHTARQAQTAGIGCAAGKVGSKAGSTPNRPADGGADQHSAAASASQPEQSRPKGVTTAGVLERTQQQQQQQQHAGNGTADGGSNTASSTQGQQELSSHHDGSPLRQSGSFNVATCSTNSAAAAAADTQAASSAHGSSVDHGSILPALESRGDINSSGSLEHFTDQTAGAASSLAEPTTVDTSSSSPSGTAATDSTTGAAGGAQSSTRGNSRSGNSKPHSSRLGMTELAAPASASASTKAGGLTVGMLSAMEAVRQSWLQEEEHKIMQASLSGAANAAAGPSLASSPTARSATTTRASVASFFLGSNSGATGCSLAGTPAAAGSSSSGGGTDALFAADGGAIASGRASNAGLLHSGNGGYCTGTPFKIPDVPALRLDELCDTADGAESTHRASSRAMDSVRDNGAASHRSIKPILRHMDSNRFSKHVQVSIAVPVDEMHEAATPPRSPAAAVLQQSTSSHSTWQEQQDVARHSVVSAASSNARRAADVNSATGLSSPRNPAGSRPAGRLVAAAGCRLESDVPGSRGSKSRSSSMKKPPPPMLMLTDADDAIAACRNMASVGCTWTGLGGDDGAAADDVCFTPHAPAEGGKKNALMMRKLTKGKSLKRLEEVMLMVASQSAEVAGADWE